MISRRSIRIKAMQGLFAYEFNVGLKISGLNENLKRSIRDVHALYLYNFLVAAKVIEYIGDVNRRKEQKHIRNDADQLDESLFLNPIYQFLQEDPAFLAACKRYKLESYLDKDLIKTVHQEFIKSAPFLKYTALEKKSIKDHRKIIEDLLRKIIWKNEDFIQHFERYFICWIDDRKMLTTLVANAIRNFQKATATSTFIDTSGFWKERQDFGIDLQTKTIDHKEEYLAIIQPQLINWKLDRVNHVDVLLLKMALCELLHFPTIPVKVTINEYIELAKVYSTPKSKDFVNGILDALLKKLKEEGRIRKIGRGLVES